MYIIFNLCTRYITLKKIFNNVSLFFFTKLLLFIRHCLITFNRCSDGCNFITAVSDSSIRSSSLIMRVQFCSWYVSERKEIRLEIFQNTGEPKHLPENVKQSTIIMFPLSSSRLFLISDSLLFFILEFQLGFSFDSLTISSGSTLIYAFISSEFIPMFFCSTLLTHFFQNSLISFAMFHIIFLSQIFSFVQTSFFYRFYYWFLFTLLCNLQNDIFFPLPLSTSQFFSFSFFYIHSFISFNFSRQIFLLFHLQLFLLFRLSICIILLFFFFFSFTFCLYFPLASFTPVIIKHSSVQYFCPYYLFYFFLSFSIFHALFLNFIFLILLLQFSGVSSRC